MMSIWSHRPRLLHLALFVAAYVLGCAFAKALGIAPGTNISIWPPGGLFMATLILTSARSWPWWVLAGCLGELMGQFLWFHSPVRLETMREVLAFVVLAAGVAPIVSATIGSATLEWFGIKSQTFTSAWPL